MCVEYRELNKSTAPDRYLMPTCGEQLNDLAEVAACNGFFSCFDLYSVFWQMPTPPEERDKTSFVTHNSLFRCTAMPFGLVNAPAVFQRMMNTAPADCIDSVFCSVYTDEIVLYSKTYDVAHRDVGDQDRHRHQQACIRHRDQLRRT